MKRMKHASKANIANIASEWSERCKQLDIARDQVARLKHDCHMKKRALSLSIREREREREREKTRPDTRLRKSRAGRQGPYLRSPDHLGRSSEVKEIKS